MLEFVGDVVKFMLVWFSVFFLHELCHSFESWRQSGFWGHIHCSGFSMYTIPVRVVNRSLFLLAGGLYSGIISIAVGCLVVDPILQFSLLSVGLTNFVYSFFEREYIDKLDAWDYFIGRYSLYFVVIGCCLLFRFSGWFM